MTNIWSRVKAAVSNTEPPTDDKAIMIENLQRLRDRIEFGNPTTLICLAVVDGGIVYLASIPNGHAEALGALNFAKDDVLARITEAAQADD